MPAEYSIACPFFVSVFLGGGHQMVSHKLALPFRLLLKLLSLATRLVSLFLYFPDVALVHGFS